MRSPKLGKPFSSKDFILLLAAFLFFVVAGIIHQNTKKPDLKLSKQDTAININSELLIYGSAGNKRLLSDMLWIQTLLEADIDRYVDQSKLNWLFVRFKTISMLDPYFYENYYWGGRYLAIIKDDLEGGVNLLEKGLKYFPNDYQLNYLLGFTYYYELGNYDKGIKHLEGIMSHPKAPFYLKTIVMKMKIEKGFSIDSALELLRAQLQESHNSEFNSKLKNDFYSLKAERDLKCLNYTKVGCDNLDGDEKPYIFKNGRYHTYRGFVPYRLHKKGNKQKAVLIDTM